MLNVFTRFARTGGRKEDVGPLSVLAPGLELTGTLRAEGQVRIDGRVNGSVRVTGTLVIGPEGEVRGDVVADSVVVGGRVRGNVEVSGTVTLATTAEIDGDIRALRLSVQDGAAVNGRMAVGDLALLATAAAAAFAPPPASTSAGVRPHDSPPALVAAA